jgi:hypothetical protein
VLHGQEKPLDESAEVDLLAGVEFRACELDGGHGKKWKVIGDQWNRMKQALVVSGSLGGKLAELFEIERRAAAEVEGGDGVAQRAIKCGVGDGKVGGNLFRGELHCKGNIRPTPLS